MVYTILFSIAVSILLLIAIKLFVIWQCLTAPGVSTIQYSLPSKEVEFPGTICTSTVVNHLGVNKLREMEGITYAGTTAAC